MDRQLRRELKRCYTESEPQRKIEFLNQLNMPRASKREFVLDQLGYIHKLGWLLSAALLLLVFWFGQIWVHSGLQDSLLSAVSAVFPFFALAAALEGGRSAACGMAEMESSTKYPLADVILIRMGTLSFLNVIAILGAFVFVRQHVTFGVLQTGIYLFLPYLLTCVLTLVIQNRVAGKNTRWYCGAAGVLVSALALLLPGIAAELYKQKYLKVWLILSVFLIYQIGKQIKKMKINLEAGLWNLYLTE